MKYSTVSIRTEIRMVAVLILAIVLTGHARIEIGVSGSAWF
jgi:hypothetical protein